MFNQVDLLPVPNNTYYIASSTTFNFALVCAGSEDPTWEDPHGDSVPMESDNRAAFVTEGVGAFSTKLSQTTEQQFTEGYYLCQAKDENRVPQTIRIGLFMNGRGIMTLIAS